MFRNTTTFGGIANSLVRHGSSSWPDMTGKRGFHQVWPMATAPPPSGPGLTKEQWQDDIHDAYFLPRSRIEAMKKILGKDFVNTMVVICSGENASIIQRRKNEAALAGTGGDGMGQDPGIDPSQEQNRLLKEELQDPKIMEWTKTRLVETGKQMDAEHGISTICAYSGLYKVEGPDGQPVKVRDYTGKQVNQAINCTVHVVTVVGGEPYTYSVVKNIEDPAGGLPVDYGYEWAWNEKRGIKPESKIHPAAKGEGSDGRSFTSVTLICGDVNNLEPLEFQGEPIDIGRADLVLNPSSIPVSGSVDRAGTAVIVQPGYQRMPNFDRMLNTNYKVIPLDQIRGRGGQVLAGGSFISQIYSKAVDMTKAVYDAAFGPKAGSSSLFTVKETPGLKLIATPGPIKLPTDSKDLADFLRDSDKLINDIKNPKKPGEGGQDPKAPSTETEEQRQEQERERQEREREQREREEREHREREGKALRAEPPAVTYVPPITFSSSTHPSLLTSTGGTPISLLATSNNDESGNLFNALDQEVHTYDPPFKLPGLTASSVTSDVKIKDNFLVTHRLAFHPTGIKTVMHFIICRLIEPTTALQAAYYHTIYTTPFAKTAPKWHVDNFDTIVAPIQNALTLVGRTISEGTANPEADWSSEKRLLRSSLLLHSSPDTQEKVTSYSTSTSLTLGGNVGAFGMDPTAGADVSYSMSSSKGTEVPSVSITNYSNTQTAMWQFTLDSKDSAAATSTFQPLVQYVLRTPDDGPLGPRSNLPEKKGEEVMLEVATVSLEDPDLTPAATGREQVIAYPVRVTVE